MPEDISHIEGFIDRYLFSLDEEQVVEYMTAYLKKRGYRVIRLPPPRRELPGSIRITDYDPDTGELRSERFIEQRDGDGRPI